MSYAAMAWARRQITGSPTLKAVLLAIANYADEDGAAWPSQVRLAKDTELSERSIIRAIQELSEIGLLVIERRSSPSGRKTNLLALKVTQPDSVSLRPKVTESHLPKVTACPKQPDRVSPKPLENRSVVSVAGATGAAAPDAAAEMDRELFALARQKFGKSSGGQITKLKRARGVAVALDDVRRAPDGAPGLEYIAGILRSNRSGQERVDDAFEWLDEQIARHSPA